MCCCQTNFSSTHNACGGKSNISDRKSTRLNSSHLVISYAVFCLKKKKTNPDSIFSLIIALYDNIQPYITLATLGFLRHQFLITLAISLLCSVLFVLPVFLHDYDT